jgi:hypothetical protein
MHSEEHRTSEHRLVQFGFSSGYTLRSLPVKLSFEANMTGRGVPKHAEIRRCVPNVSTL